MKTRDYKIDIFWSEKENGFIGTVPAFEGLVVFGESREEALHETELALESFIEIYQEDGRTLPKPDKELTYSGQIRLRLPKDLHRRAAERAEAEGVSLNTLLVDAVASRTNYTATKHRVLTEKTTIIYSVKEPIKLTGQKASTASSLGSLMDYQRLSSF